MAKVYLIAGKICSGKSTFAKKLCAEKKAVLLSTDEITLAIFGQHIGEKHDEVVENTQNYLFEKSIEIVSTGISVCLDWGFWQKSERDYAKQYFHSRGIETEFFCIDIHEDEWKRRVEKRNRSIQKEGLSAYYVDENLRIKFDNLFEAPTKEENLLFIK
ncbi:MAG: ATP-binding protein [Clostridia bacterium]|nr:ATP-binding protein [Clostridia bacterium]